MLSMTVLNSGTSRIAASRATAGTSRSHPCHLIFIEDILVPFQLGQPSRPSLVHEALPTPVSRTWILLCAVSAVHRQDDTADLTRPIAQQPRGGIAHLGRRTGLPERNRGDPALDRGRVVLPPLDQHRRLGGP